jgi:hypothetical protein
MATYLKARYGEDKVIATKEFIIAQGDIPIGLVAHMDTVHEKPVEDLFYDREKGVLWSPQGLGADDRAGIFAIIQIIKSGLKPHIILTTDEEYGGIGASALVELFDEHPFEDLKYLIELDRRGTNDCVFYDCYNAEFTDYIEKFGFVENWGTFSDISILCPVWQICGVNLSVGYMNEHSYSEILCINPLFDTIKKVKVMLQQKDIPTFQYASFRRWGYAEDWWGEDYKGLEHMSCSKCRKTFSEYELFPVKGLNDRTKFFCPDCMVGRVDWCYTCGEAYELSEGKNCNCCKDCEESVSCVVGTNIKQTIPTRKVETAEEASKNV